MATTNISQLRRIVFRKKTADGWTTMTLGPDDLGGDEQLTINIAPRKMERASSLGTTEMPIAGTLDAFAGSITFLANTWATLGKVLGRWNAATYEGATAASGNVLVGEDGTLCDDGAYYSVIAQGLCDDGSSADVELTRCVPSIDDDITIGTSSTTEVTLALNPIIYNANEHANDGYPAYSARLGDYDLVSKQRLNATTGEYEAVTAPQE